MRSLVSVMGTGSVRCIHKWRSKYEGINVRGCKTLKIVGDGELLLKKLPVDNTLNFRKSFEYKFKRMSISEDKITHGLSPVGKVNFKKHKLIKTKLWF